MSVLIVSVPGLAENMDFQNYSAVVGTWDVSEDWYRNKGSIFDWAFVSVLFCAKNMHRYLCTTF